jgi:hypothetical protein
LWDWRDEIKAAAGMKRRGQPEETSESRTDIGHGMGWGD